MAKNNFPRSGFLWNSAIVPSRQVAVENDLHGFEEVGRAFSPGFIDSGQDVYGDLQSLGGLRLLHELLGDRDRVKHYALAGPREVRKQPVLDGIMLGAVGG